MQNKQYVCHEINPVNQQKLYGKYRQTIHCKNWTVNLKSIFGTKTQQKKQDTFGPHVCTAENINKKWVNAATRQMAQPANHIKLLRVQFTESH